jgi:hypothetical protein
MPVQLICQYTKMAKGPARSAAEPITTLRQALSLI